MISFQKAIGIFIRSCIILPFTKILLHKTAMREIISNASYPSQVSPTLFAYLNDVYSFPCPGSSRQGISLVHLYEYMYTVPHIAPENGWVEYDFFLLGVRPIFLVSGRVDICLNTPIFHVKD